MSFIANIGTRSVTKLWLTICNALLSSYSKQKTLSLHTIYTEEIFKSFDRIWEQKKKKNDRLY